MQKIIIVSGPVIVEKGKVLLNQHGDTTFWKFCGGELKGSDINLTKGAEREAKEEMGIGIEIIDPTPFITHTTKEMPEGTVDVILVHYLAKRVGEIHTGQDIREWKWFSLDRLPENLASNITSTLRHFGFLF